MVDELFCVRASRATLERVLGAPEFRDVDSNGLGPMDGWRMTFPCGLEVFVWLFLIHPNGAPVAPDELAFVEIHSASRDEAHVAFHLPFIGTSASAPLEWCVRRQDDNGNIEEVGRYSSRCEAEAVSRSYEARGHKQSYWVERLE